MKKQNCLILLFSASSLLTGCGGGSNGDSSNTEYDLTEYLYHDSLNVTDTFYSFTEISYSKESGEPTGEAKESYVKRATNEISIAKLSISGSFYSPTVLHVLNVDTIDIENYFYISEGVYESTPTDLFLKRYNEVGDEYYTEDFSGLAGQTATNNTTCTLIEHLESFNLATVTGNLNLASGIYSDVLHTHCITGAIDPLMGEPNEFSDIHFYYAKDVGPIFSEGNLGYIPGYNYAIPQL